jgi:hypothetical protein
MYHSLYRNADGLVLSLRNSILPRVVRDCELLLDPCLLAKILEVIVGALFPII